MRRWLRAVAVLMFGPASPDWDGLNKRDNLLVVGPVSIVLWYEISCVEWQRDAEKAADLSDLPPGGVNDGT